MAINNTAYLSLVCIDPASNKRRVYLIQIFPQPEKTMTVSCSWGRVNSNRRSLTLTFHEEEGISSYIEEILKRRKRNGYHVFSKSDNFPSSPTLLEIPETETIGGQLKLL